MKFTHYIFLALVLAGTLQPARADDFAARCANRAAIERVYHVHRVGTKQPFEQAMPQEMIERLVRQDEHKESVLRRVYGVEIT